MKCTLREWQTIKKPREELIMNSSDPTGNDGYVPFPIGMGFRYIMWNKSHEIPQFGHHTDLALACFTTYTDLRRRSNSTINRVCIENTLQKLGYTNICIESPFEFYSKLPNYKFIFSPEGYGIDCHRHYEAFMAGCIPIIEHNDMMKEKYPNCPILYTTDYSECTPEYLEEKYKEMIDKVWDFSPLFLSSYSTELQNQIKQNGNYWCRNLTGMTWYV